MRDMFNNLLVTMKNNAIRVKFRNLGSENNNSKQQELLKCKQWDNKENGEHFFLFNIFFRIH